MDSRQGLERLLKKNGVEANLEGLSLEHAKDVARAVEKFQRAYPEYKDALRLVYSDKAGWSAGTRRLDQIGNKLAKYVHDRQRTQAATNVRYGTGRATEISIQTGRIPKAHSAYVTGGSHEGTMWHELGHVVENWLIADGRNMEGFFRSIVNKVYKGDVKLLSSDTTIYATSDGHELLAEIFHIANQKGGIKAFTRNPAEASRIRQIIDFYNEKGIIIREPQI